MRPVLILLNPPATLLTMRDYFCSSSSKAGYLWQPMDFICQSGYLAEHFDIRLIDAPAMRLQEKEAIRIVEGIKPSVIYSLIGTANLSNDFALLKELSRVTSAKIFVSGDIARFCPFFILERHPFIDGVVLNFTTSALANFLTKSETHPSSLALKGESPRDLPLAKGDFSYPIPSHDLFWSLNYRMPFLGKKFASILTNYGCPFRCTFCNSCNIGYAERNLENLFEEINFLSSKSVQYLFIKDFTFNARPDRSKIILSEWLKKNYRFNWIGYFRAELIDSELAELLKRTRCEIAQIGIETANEPVLSRLKQGSTLERIESGIAELKRQKIRYGAHFMFGLPKDDEKGFEDTVKLAKKLGLSYASFNFFTPRPGSELADSIKDWQKLAMDPSRPIYKREGAQKLDKQVKKAYLKFYLRPKYFFSVIKGTRSLESLHSTLSMGFGLFKSIFGREK